MGFRLLDSNITFPALYPKVERKLPTAKDKGWTKVGGFTLRSKIDLMPQLGLQENLCKCEANLIFICGAATSGKAQPYDAKVLTPKGFVQMGSLKVGDTITGADGKPQKVLQIFEQGEREVCRVDFSDGSTTECDYEHLWNVKVSRTKIKRKSAVMTTRQIINALNNDKSKYSAVKHIYVPLVKPVGFDYGVNLPIKPYVLGAILGDGCSRIPKSKLRIYTPDKEIIERISSDGYPLKFIDYSDCGWTFESNDVKESLIKLDLWFKLSYDKFIPKEYLKASVEDRFALLQGLMDTDGYANGHSYAEYSTSSEKLAEDVRTLVLSLGGRCTISTRIPKYTYKGETKEGHKSYRVYVSFDNQQCVFSISSKRNKCKNERNKHYNIGREIVGCSHVGKKQCRCLLVSNPDHLYVTDDFIVTHNTYGMYLKSMYGMDKAGFTSIMFSYREKDSKKGSSIFRDAVEVLGNYPGCEFAASDNINFRFPKYNSQLQLANFNYNITNPTEWADFKEDMKKKQASLIMVDEMTKMLERAMLYLFSRNRDSSGMKPQFIGSFNPEHEHFTRKVIQDAGFMDDNWNVKKEMEGKLKYFILKGDTFASAVWGDTPKEVVEAAGITISAADRAAGLTEEDMCKSFTVFTGEAADNRILVNATGGQSVANLVNSGDSDVLKRGSFAPREVDELSVNRNMIHSLWDNPISEDENMYATLDVSGGNTDSDNCPMCIFKGNSLVTVKVFKGDPKQLVDWIDTNLRTYGVPVENFAFDATGIGNYLRAYTSGVPLTANRRPIQEIDSKGNSVNLDSYFNLRSQLLSRLEVALQKGELNFAIPKDLTIPYGKKGEQRRVIDILFDEMNVLVFSYRNGKRYARSKDEYKAKFHSSPDLMDTIMLFMYFFLDAKPKKQQKPTTGWDAYDALYKRPPMVAYNSYRRRY